ncbi:MAG: DNA repair protein RecN [Gammaproteobacteria bacterium]|nr:DNA repair protein RecN [Gammaproteobacteria bacterium]
MLTHIHIRDFAIVDRLDVDLEAGMNALTGETGAGKSILVDALGLALGDRADSGTVRHGAEQAEIGVGFAAARSAGVEQWLAERDLDADGECLIRRIVSRDGRSKAYVNGRPVPTQLLKELGEKLVDIHGQHEHQSLLKRDTQRDMLDDYAGHGALLDALAGLFHQWKTLDTELESLRRAMDERAARLDLLRFQVQELEALNPGADELEALNEEHVRLAHAGRLLETSQRLLDEVYQDDDNSLYTRLGRALGELEPLCRIDARLAGTHELFGSALTQLQEGAETLRHYLDHVDLDPQRLHWLDQRLGVFHDLARKHRVAPGELHDLLQRLRRELDALAHADERLEALQQDRDRLSEDYQARARTLSEGRRRAAQALGARVTGIMQELGMPGGRFEITVQPLPDGKPGPSGIDGVEFQVSANPGQPLKPLGKVASGDELSRISLAIHVVAARSAKIDTLVFDEVDAGIGGGVAEIVGQQLRALGASRQVLCVTHLPQVAAQAHHHLQVNKQTRGGSTRVEVRPLPAEERIEEIARMLGGVEITAQTRAHAGEMIERARKNADRKPAAGGRKKPSAAG